MDFASVIQLQRMADSDLKPIIQSSIQLFKYWEICKFKKKAWWIAVQAMFKLFTRRFHLLEACFFTRKLA
jgi:hypothetical protein